jgi:phosphinothricin acetyltransferase
MTVRPAREDDFSEVCRIVNRYIESTSINFRCEPQEPAEWVAEWSATGRTHPWLVATEDEHVVGVAYAGPWKARSAYAWCAETTIYVAEGRHRSGHGAALYTELLRRLDEQGFRSALAVIALPNLASVAFHERFGYRAVGTLVSIGHKHGAWHDVGFWQRSSPRLDASEMPAPPAPVEEAR